MCVLCGWTGGRVYMVVDDGIFGMRATTTDLLYTLYGTHIKLSEKNRYFIEKKTSRFVYTFKPKLYAI